VKIIGAFCLVDKHYKLSLLFLELNKVDWNL
jgi:hypothetical protein